MLWTYDMGHAKIERWFTDTDPDIHRLMISHTDLDGYACRVVAQVARANMLAISSEMMPNVTYCHVAPGKSEEAVSMYVNNPDSHYIKGESKLLILITDLGSIDLRFYSNMIKTSHNLELIVVDHHQTTFKEEFEESQEDAYHLEFHYNRDVAAALVLYYTVDMWITDAKTRTNLYKYCEMVTKYDTGRWSSWRNAKFNDIPLDMFHQILYITYRNSVDDMKIYVDDMCTRIQNGADVFDVGAVCLRDRFVKEWLDLHSEYTWFKTMMKDMSITKPIGAFTYGYNGSIANRPTLKVMGIEIENKEDDPSYFSLISREILEDDTSIDILVLVNHVRKTVELRSAKDSVNVAEIAKLNGGGGHPKAAGFPMK